jgi:hypothetical protein
MHRSGAITGNKSEASSAPIRAAGSNRCSVTPRASLTSPTVAARRPKAGPRGRVWRSSRSCAANLSSMPMATVPSLKSSRLHAETVFDALQTNYFSSLCQGGSSSEADTRSAPPHRGAPKLSMPLTKLQSGTSSKDPFSHGRWWQLSGALSLNLSKLVG